MERHELSEMDQCILKSYELMVREVNKKHENGKQATAAEMNLLKTTIPHVENIYAKLGYKGFWMDEIENLDGVIGVDLIDGECISIKLAPNAPADSIYLAQEIINSAHGSVYIASFARGDDEVVVEFVEDSEFLD